MSTRRPPPSVSTRSHVSHVSSVKSTCSRRLLVTETARPGALSGGTVYSRSFRGDARELARHDTGSSVEGLQVEAVACDQGYAQGYGHIPPPWARPYELSDDEVEEPPPKKAACRMCCLFLCCLVPAILIAAAGLALLLMTGGVVRVLDFSLDGEDFEVTVNSGDSHKTFLENTLKAFAAKRAEGMSDDEKAALPQSVEDLYENHRIAFSGDDDNGEFEDRPLSRRLMWQDNADYYVPTTLFKDKYNLNWAFDYKFSRKGPKHEDGLPKPIHVSEVWGEAKSLEQDGYWEDLKNNLAVSLTERASHSPEDLEVLKDTIFKPEDAELWFPEELLASGGPTPNMRLLAIPMQGIHVRLRTHTLDLRLQLFNWRQYVEDRTGDTARNGGRIVMHNAKQVSNELYDDVDVWTANTQRSSTQTVTQRIIVKVLPGEDSPKFADDKLLSTLLPDADTDVMRKNLLYIQKAMVTTTPSSAGVPDKVYWKDQWLRGSNMGGQFILSKEDGTDEGVQLATTKGVDHLYRVASFVYHTDGVNFQQLEDEDTTVVAVNGGSGSLQDVQLVIIKREFSHAEFESHSPTDSGWMPKKEDAEHGFKNPVKEFSTCLPQQLAAEASSGQGRPMDEIWDEVWNEREKVRWAEVHLKEIVFGMEGSVLKMPVPANAAFHNGQHCFSEDMFVDSESWVGISHMKEVETPGATGHKKQFRLHFALDINLPKHFHIGKDLRSEDTTRASMSGSNGEAMVDMITRIYRVTLPEQDQHGKELTPAEVRSRLYQFPASSNEELKFIGVSAPLQTVQADHATWIVHATFSKKSDWGGANGGLSPLSADDPVREHILTSLGVESDSLKDGDLFLISAASWQFGSMVVFATWKVDKQGQEWDYSLDKDNSLEVKVHVRQFGTENRMIRFNELSTNRGDDVTEVSLKEMHEETLKAHCDWDSEQKKTDMCTWEPVGEKKFTQSEVAALAIGTVEFRVNHEATMLRPALYGFKVPKDLAEPNAAATGVGGKLENYQLAMYEEPLEWHRPV